MSLLHTERARPPTLARALKEFRPDLWFTGD